MMFGSRIKICLIILCVISGIHAKKNKVVIKNIALSLNTLQNTIKNKTERKMPLNVDLLTLGGLNNPRGFIVDKKNSDIVLYGKSLKPGKDLHLDDIAVAIQNVLVGDTLPECYIRINEEEKEDYHVLMNNLYQRGTANEKTISLWKQKRRKREIRVVSIPHNSHFASKMVEADMILKEFAHNDHRIRVAGLKTYLDINFYNNSKLLDKTDPINNAFYNDFWLFPDKIHVEQAASIFNINQASLKLFPAEDLFKLSDYYARKSKQEFTLLFNERFQKIKEKEPVFVSVENLLSLLVIFNQIISQELDKEVSSFSPEFWNENYTLESVEVPKEFPTIYNSFYIDTEVNKSYSERADVDYIVLYAYLCVSGGILLDYKNTIKVLGKKSDVLPKLKDAILSKRPSPQALFWEY